MITAIIRPDEMNATAALELQAVVLDLVQPLSPAGTFLPRVGLEGWNFEGAYGSYGVIGGSRVGAAPPVQPETRFPELELSRIATQPRGELSGQIGSSAR